MAENLSIFDIITDNIAIRLEDCIPSISNSKLNKEEQDKFNEKFMQRLNEIVCAIKEDNNKIQNEHGMFEKEAELIRRINEATDEEKIAWRLPNDFVVSAHALVENDKKDYIKKLEDISNKYDKFCVDLEKILHEKHTKMNDLFESSRLSNEKLNKLLSNE